VIFSALSSKCLETFIQDSPTERTLHVVPLNTLSVRDARLTLDRLLRVAPYSTVIEAFGMEYEKWLALLFASIGTIPRALELALLTLREWARSYPAHDLVFNRFVDSVSATIADRYSSWPSIPEQIVLHALLGIPTTLLESFTSPLSQRTLTPAAALQRGYIKAVNPNGTVSMNPLQIMAFARSLTDEATELRTILVDLITTPRRFSLNRFEVAYRHRILLFGYYIKLRHSATISVRDFFSPCRLFLQEGVDMQVDATAAFNPTIWSYADVPTPDMMKRLPAARGHIILAPLSSFEPAVDTLCLFRRPDGPHGSNLPPWLVVGVQNKMSDHGDQTMSGPDLKNAAQRFRCRMTFRGWPEQSLMFVAVVCRRPPAYLTTSDHSMCLDFVKDLGNMVLISHPHVGKTSPSLFEQHLGPSFLELLHQFYKAPLHGSNYPVILETVVLDSAFSGEAWNAHKQQFGQVRNIITIVHSYPHVFCCY
jgi:hypothetical protein